ncbi:hypothetical protein R1sor_011435 [Riccia sorocarpa]|uniref:Uncharacterized protein n=1 Tax=Riccia sorocarpa TaxID=122646 RepID=A0ABD3I2P8_9MARC
MEWVAFSVTREEFQATSFLDTLDVALKVHKKNLGSLLLISEVSKLCWLERNSIVLLAPTLAKIRSGEGIYFKRLKEEDRQQMEERVSGFWWRADRVMKEMNRHEDEVRNLCEIIEGRSEEPGAGSEDRRNRATNDASGSIKEDSSCMAEPWWRFDKRPMGKV